ncbi:MAG TPA: hypothetical protein VGM90_40345 [Kofleriaceae bacterium]
MTVTAFAFATLSLVACGGGGGSGDDGLSTAHEGVYTVSSWNGNMTSCDGVGVPLDPPASTARLYIKSESVLGTSFINVVPCDDEASCQADAESSTLMTSLLGWTFSSGSDADGWTGTGGEYATGSGDTCSGVSSVATMKLTGTTAHIENRQSQVQWAKPAGGCTIDDLHAHAAGAACTSLITVDGTFATDL